MLKRTNLLTISFILVICISFSCAETWKYNYLPTEETDLNLSNIVINLTSNMTKCWDTAEGIKCDVADITYDEISGGDVNALGYTGTFNFLAGVVGMLSMDGDPWYLGGTSLELGENLTVDGNTYLSNTYPRTTLTYSLGSGAARWLNLFVQNINAEEIDAFNMHLSNNLTVDGNATITGLINGLNITEISDDSFWNRIGTILSPKTSGDSIETTGNITASNYFVGDNLLNSTHIIDHDGHSIKDTFNHIFNRGVSETITVSLTGGLDIEWTAGEVYDPSVNGFVETDAGSGTLTSDQVNYLKYTGTSTLELQTSSSTSDEILVARFANWDGIIAGKREISLLDNLLSDTGRGLRIAFPNRIISGMSVSEDTDITNSLDVSMDAGQMIKDGINEVNPSAIDSRTTPIVRLFHSGGDWTNDTNAEIDTIQYDDGNDLANIPANKWVKAYFIYMPNKLGWIYPTAYYNTKAQAEAGALSTIPEGLALTPKLTTVIYQQGDTDFSNAEWQDVRPGISEESFNIVSDHGDLAGLSDDDHPQYLLADGSRSLTGNWDAGYNITAPYFFGNWNGSSDYVPITADNTNISSVLNMTLNSTYLSINPDASGDGLYPTTSPSVEFFKNVITGERPFFRFWGYSDAAGSGADYYDMVPDTWARLIFRTSGAFGFLFQAPITLDNNDALIFSSAGRAHMKFNTIDNEDYLMLGLTDSGDDTAVFAIIDRADRNSIYWNFPHLTSPRVYIASSDAGQDRIWLEHDGTDGNIASDAGNLNLRVKGSNAIHILNDSGSDHGSIVAGEFLLGSPEIKDYQGNYLDKIKTTTQIMEDGKLNKYDISGVSLQKSKVKDESNCVQIPDGFCWGQDEPELTCGETIPKGVKDAEPQYRIECQTKEIDTIPLGEIAFTQEAKISELLEYIKSLEKRIEVLEK